MIYIYLCIYYTRVDYRHCIVTVAQTVNVLCLTLLTPCIVSVAHTQHKQLHTQHSQFFGTVCHFGSGTHTQAYIASYIDIYTMIYQHLEFLAITTTTIFTGHDIVMIILKSDWPRNSWRRDLSIVLLLFYYHNVVMVDILCYS